MKIISHKAEDRGQADFGWFKAKYSFSFGQWHNPNRMGFGALRVFNDSVIQPNKGFPEHPHDNMEVITVQLQGKLEHTDISGTRIIQEGDVQVITAGKGVTHSDLNIGNVEAKQFQIWIYPNQHNAKPESNIAHFNKEDRENRWQVLASPYGDESSPLHLLQNAWLSRGVFDADSEQVYKLHDSSNGVYLFVIDGKLEIENLQGSKRDAFGISEIDQVKFKCLLPSDILIAEVPLV